MRILLVDDHPVFRSGLELLMKGLEPGVEVLHAGSCEEGVRIARRRALNLVFLDLRLPDSSGLDCLKAMKQVRPSLPVVLISGEQVDRDLIEQALDLRAMGFVPKSENAETIAAALRAALTGGVYLPAHLAAKGTAPARDLAPHGTVDESFAAHSAPLRLATLGITPRQRDVLRYLVQGLPNKRIATKLAISVPVVKKHVSDLLAHFQVMSRTQLMALMARNGVRFGTPELSDPKDEILEEDI